MDGLGVRDRGNGVVSAGGRAAGHSKCVIIKDQCGINRGSSRTKEKESQPRGSCGTSSVNAWKWPAEPSDAQ